MDRDGSPGDNGRNDIAVCHIKNIKSNQLAVGVGDGTVLDSDGHYRDNINCHVICGSIPRP